MSTRRLSATPRATPLSLFITIFCIEKLRQRRYLLNLVQENRKGIEAAAQQWREGAKTDSQLMQVLQASMPQQQRRLSHSYSCLQSSGGDVLAELLDAEQVNTALRTLRAVVVQ